MSMHKLHKTAKQLKVISSKGLTPHEMGCLKLRTTVRVRLMKTLEND